MPDFDDLVAFDSADLVALFLIWIVIGMLILIACNVHAFWNHVDRRYVWTRGRMAPGWLVFALTVLAVVLWPALPFVMARLRAAEHSSRGF